MPQRIVNIKNPGPEIEHPEVEEGNDKIDFDGQTYQFGPNSREKQVLPDGAAVRETRKVDDSTSTLRNPDTAPVRS